MAKKSLISKIMENTGKFGEKYSKTTLSALITLKLSGSGYCLYGAINQASQGEYLQATIAGLASVVFAYSVGYTSGRLTSSEKQQ